MAKATQSDTNGNARELAAQPHRKLAVITGAGGRLGAAFAAQLAREGNWHLVLLDVDKRAVEQTLATLEPTQCPAQALPFDVAAPEEWSQLLQQLQEKWPRLELLLNVAGVCAGGVVAEAPPQCATPGEPDPYHRLMEINFFGALYGCRTFVPWMQQQSAGHIVNVASVTGFLAPPAMSAYASSKAATIALSESLAAELKPEGVGVTICAPGFFQSSLIERGAFADPQLQQRALNYANRSRLTAEQVAAATMRAVRRRRLYAVMGRRARWYWRLKRLAPAWLAGRLSKQYIKHSQIH